MANDLLQLVREAIVSIVDTDPEIFALTGRLSRNIVSFNSLDDAPNGPIIAYLIVVGTELASDGDTRDLVVQFTASAEKEATVQELLGVLERIVSASAFAALASPLDAFPVRRVRRTTDLDVTLRVSRPSPVPA